MRSLLLLAGLLVGSLGEARAGALGVAPTRLDLAPAAPAGMVTVRNDDDYPITVQVETFAWIDQPSIDALEPTRELIAVPPLFQLLPGEKKIIRVARRRPLSGAQEATYRLLISEVPASGQASGNGVRFALRLSLPVFTTPAGATPRPQLQAREGPGEVKLTVTNPGTAHLHVKRLALLDAASAEITSLETSTYVLAGHAAELRVPVPQRSNDAVLLKAETNIGDLDLALPNNPR